MNRIWQRRKDKRASLGRLAGDGGGLVSSSRPRIRDVAIIVVAGGVFGTGVRSMRVFDVVANGKEATGSSSPRSEI